MTVKKNLNWNIMRATNVSMEVFTTKKTANGGIHSLQTFTYNAEKFQLLSIAYP